jgi:hypothetical protein
MNPVNPITDTAPEARPSARRTWLREPLLHFLLIGAALFALDAYVASKTEDPRVIVIDEAVDRQAIDVFKAARGRDPNEEEVYALRRVWLDNEVLYREGLALGMDQGDAAIKDRVIFKALSMINAGLSLPALDDAVVRAWFEKNRARYDEPERFDFEEAVLSGDSDEQTARRFAQALNDGTPGDAKAGLRVFQARPRGNLVQSYGEEFTKALAALEQGRWTALPQRDGWRVFRLTGLKAPKPASYEELRGPVLQDWKDTTMSEMRSAAVREMARKYVVQTTPVKP